MVTPHILRRRGLPTINRAVLNKMECYLGESAPYGVAAGADGDQGANLPEPEELQADPEEVLPARRTRRCVACSAAAPNWR
jgi:hypothetical protein